MMAIPADKLSEDVSICTPSSGVVKKRHGAEIWMSRSNNNLHSTTCLRRTNSSEPIHKSALFQRRQKSAQATVPNLNSFRASSLEREAHTNQVDETSRRSKSNPEAPKKDLRSPISPSRPLSARRSGSTPLLTPPEELDSCAWGSILAPCYSSPEQQDPPLVLLSGTHISNRPQNVSSDKAPAANPAMQSSNEGQGVSFQGGADPNDGTDSDFVGESAGWLAQAATIAVSSIDPSKPSSASIGLVSQTLPSPAQENAQPKPLFTDTILAIQSHFSLHKQPYIQISHAVPPRFELLDLPTSPPSTPNVFVGQTDYFSQTIFAHAAVVPHYHSISTTLGPPIPASPNTIVAPSSVQIAVLERYIPPASALEVRQLFSPTGRSALIDRMAELSPERGSLVFVYPTRQGATTFKKAYLMPVIVPLLRYIVELHSLSYTVAEDLGAMPALDEMLPFTQLRARLVALCAAMSSPSNTIAGASRYVLAHAETGLVSLDRKTWADWYLKQEHARCKTALEKYWGEGRRLSQVEGASAGSVLREFITGVGGPGVGEAGVVGPGVEVGVFVVRRVPFGGQA